MTFVPASENQLQMWLSDQAAPGSAINNLPELWSLSGPLDVTALRRALDLLVGRHEMLRTTLHYVDGQLCQRVEDRWTLPLAVHDVLTRPADERASTTSEIVRSFAGRPFDLARDLPARALLIRTGDRRHLFGLVVHHAAADSVSFAVLREELDTAYRALAAGRLPALRPAGSRYQDVAPAAGPAPSGPATAADERAFPPAPSLPLDRPRPIQPLARGATVRVYLPRQAMDGLAALATRQGKTTFSVLFGIFGWMMGTWAGQDRITVTTPASLRDPISARRTVGCFVRTLPVPLDLARPSTLLDLAGQVQRTVVEALDAPPRPAGATGQVSFGVEGATRAPFCLGDLRTRSLSCHPGACRFDLAVRVERTPAGPSVLAEYDTGLFDRSTVRRMLDHFAELVVAASRPGGTRCGRWSTAPAADRAMFRRLGTGPRRRTTTLLPERIERALGTPGPAVLDATGEIDATRLWRAAGAFAERLAAVDVPPGSLVAVCANASVNTVVAIVGILRAGAAFVPLDPRDPPARRAAMLTECGARALVTEAGSGTCSWCGPEFPLSAVTDWDRIPATHQPGDRPDPASVAYVTHTSGSTGVPKGVMTSHLGLATYLNWAVREYGLGPGCSAPLFTSLAFDMAITSLLGPLACGGVVDATAGSADPYSCVRRGLAGHHLVKATPTQLDMLLDLPGGLSGGPTVIVLGGEGLGSAQMARFRAAFPRSTIVNEYGPTETVVGSVYWRLPAAPERTGRAAPIGRPLDDTTVRVVDGHLNPLPVGVWGELVIGGPTVSHGYLGQPGLSAARFVPDPFTGRPGARIYRTGDMARWNRAGVLELRGRLDRQLKILGYRVEPDEIEAVLAAAPGVRQAAVRAETAPRSRLVAFYAPADGPEADEERIRAHLRNRLPAHMVPDNLVRLDALPVTPSGKLDRSALPEASDGPSDGTGDDGAGNGDVGRAVHDAWCAVLGTDTVAPGVRFFDAGGTSLMLLRLGNELAVRGINGLTVADLFRHPTIADLVARIEGTRSPDTAGPDEPARRTARARRRRIQKGRRDAH